MVREMTSLSAARVQLAARDELGDAIVEIGAHLRAQGYAFTTVTPETHRRVIANNPRCGNILRDVFGWNRSFAIGDVDSAVGESLSHAGLLDPVAQSELLRRSGLRFASLGDQLFAHSAFPTESSQSVFFGPDSYRFAQLIERALGVHGGRVRRIVDIGCGSGVGGLIAASAVSNPVEVVLADVNPLALRFADGNARLAGIANVRCVLSDVFDSIDGDADVIVSNPPYLADAKERLYRHGGSHFGAELSLRILRESLPRLRLGGILVLYTGSAIVDGIDTFQTRALPALQTPQLEFRYAELDPDVFGEELDRKHYAAVERIAAVGLVVTRIR
jgi:methylase of polypeptide subunit release factors